MQWEEIRGERQSLGRRYEAQLMPVCINAVWHLSAWDVHTLWRAEILWHCVCEQVFVEVMVPVAELPAYKLHFFLLFALLCYLIHVLFHLRCLPNSEVSSSLFLSFSSSFIFVLPSSHYHYSCNLCPCENLDPLPGCSKQLIGIIMWIPFHASKFPFTSSTCPIQNRRDFCNVIHCIADFF